jgi:RimJ/RimL family protein N-acetyltransferase
VDDLRAGRLGQRLRVPDELGFTRLEIVVLPGNVASQRAAQGLRATFECTARNRLYVHGHAHDALVYSLTPKDARRWQVE